MCRTVRPTSSRKVISSICTEPLTKCCINSPLESRVGDHVEAALAPYLEKNGGPLKMQRIEFHPGRNNIIITYPGPSHPTGSVHWVDCHSGKGPKVVSFVGAHMDVVPANPEEWERGPRSHNFFYFFDMTSIISSNLHVEMNRSQVVLHHHFRLWTGN